MSLFDILKRLVMVDEDDNVNEVMRYAAYGGHIEIVKLCKEWGGGQRLLPELGLPLRNLDNNLYFYKLKRDFKSEG